MKTSRVLTMCHKGCGESRKPPHRPLPDKPQLRLQGRWLDEAGFAIGMRVGVRDVIPDNEKQHGVYGSHHNLFRANQYPYPKCDCFWQKLKDVAKPSELQPGWIPIEPFVNGQ